MRLNLSPAAAERVAGRIAWAYVIASVGAALGGAAALVYAIRWW